MPTPVSTVSPSGASASGLLGPRRRFLDSLPARLEALELVVTELEAEPESLGLRSRLQSRLEAMSDAAGALGLELMQTAFTSADSALSRARGAAAPAALGEVRDTLRLMPSLVPPELNSGARAHVAFDNPPPAPSHGAAPSSSAPGMDSAFPAVNPVPEPRTRSAVSAPAPRSPRADLANLANRRVLIADPDPAMAWFLTGVLKAAHANVVEARDGLEAWHLAEEQAPDLVISDVSLPELDGFGLCRNLKRDVALCTVPVLLVSWKEEALQRVRELGAGADGYFVKEADPTTIARRCAEALEMRVNIEKRLRKEPIVHGRIDGIAPYLLLRLVTEIVDNARVTFEDAGYRTVVRTGDGRLLSAERTLLDGTSDPGQHVLGALLGMRAGRFVVERAGECTQPLFTGSLSHVLTPEVTRIRRAMRILQSQTLGKVARVELDLAVVTPYLATSPAIVQKLAQKLIDGVVPSALHQSVSAGLLESVLGDLGRRGSVRKLIDRDGNDLLSAVDVMSLPFDLEVRTPTAGYEVVAARGAPRIDKASTTLDVLVAAQFAHEKQAERRSSDTAITSPGFPALVVPEAEAESEPLELSAPEPECELAPQTDDVGFELDADPPTKARPDMTALALQSAEPEPVPARAPELAPAAQRSVAPPVVVEPFRFHPTPAPGTARVLRPKQDEPLAAEANSVVELGSAIFGELTGTPMPRAALPRRSMTPPPAPARVAAKNELLVADSIRSPHPATDDGVSLADQLARADNAPTPVRRVVEPQRALQSSAQRSTVPLAPAMSGVVNRVEQPKPNPVAAVPTNRPERATAPISPSLTSAPEALAQRDSLELWVQRAHRWSVEAGQWIQARRRTLRRPLSAATASVAPAPLVGGTLELKAEAEPKPQSVVPEAEEPITARKPESATLPELDASDEQTSPLKKPRTRAKGPLARGLRAAGRGVVPVASLVGAGVVAYFGFGVVVARLQTPSAPDPAANQLLVPPLEADTDSDADEGADDSDLAVAPPNAKPAKAKLQMQSVDLALPDGISLAADKGLLEVNTGGGHKIYVDNVFVGRGPVRRVPLKPGKHELVLRLDGDEDTATIEIQAGRRVRFEPQASAAATP